MDIDIGLRLKTVRRAHGLSQRQLATRAGVTNGLISQVEQNKNSPSVASLKRILDAVPMTLSDFFSITDPDKDKIFHRKAELREINPSLKFDLPEDQAGTMSFRQVGDSSVHKLQMLHERYAPGADTGEELYSHEAEEAGIVIEGQIELTVGTEVATLHAGDAYIFDSRRPHRFHNTGDVDCVIVSTCTPPSF